MRRLREAAAAERRLAAARRAIETLAARDPRLAAAIKTALGDDDPDRRAGAARKAMSLIAEAAGRDRR